MDFPLSALVKYPHLVTVDVGVPLIVNLIGLNVCAVQPPVDIDVRGYLNLGMTFIEPLGVGVLDASLINSAFFSILVDTFQQLLGNVKVIYNSLDESAFIITFHPLLMKCDAINQFLFHNSYLL